MYGFLAIIVSSLLLILSSSGVLWAEDKKDAEKEEAKLEEIVVTGAKIEKELNDLPFSANVKTAEDITRQPISRAEEIVKSIPGVHAITPHVSSYGVFVTMRGHALVKQVVSMDGQPLNDGFNGYVRWSVLPTALWDRVEVIRGPFSALYGPSAMGGVINFIPKKEITENQINLSFGSFGTQSASLLYGGKIKNKLDFVIFVDEQRIDGYVGDFVVIEPRTTAPSGTITDVTGWERTSTADGKIAYKIGDRGKQYSRDHRNLYLGVSYQIAQNHDLSLNYLYARQRYGFKDGKTYLKDSTGKPFENGNIRIIDRGSTYYAAISPLNFLDMEGIAGQDVLSAKYTYVINENITLRVFGGLNTRVQEWAVGLADATSSGGPGRRGIPEGISNRFGAETEIKLGGNTLVLGAETTLNSGGSKRERLSNWKDRDSVTILEEDARGKSRITSAYSIFEFIPFKENLSIWMGGRYDNWKSYDGKMITPTKETLFASQTTSEFNPKIGILYKLISDFSVRTSYGGGFRVPGPHELYRQMITPTSVSLGNPNLKPEFNKSWEAGIGYEPKFGGIEKNIKVNYFYDITNDLIYIKRWKDAHPDDPTKQVDFLRRQNAGKAKTTGVELEIGGKTKIYDDIKLSWSANASLQNPKITENTAEPSTVGKVIPYIPRRVYNLELNAEKDKVSLGLLLHSRGKVYVKDDNSDVVNGVPGSMDPFTTIDAKLRYKIHKNCVFSITANNLLDKEYYSMGGPKAPGRSLYADLTVKF